MGFGGVCRQGLARRPPRGAGRGKPPVSWDSPAPRESLRWRSRPRPATLKASPEAGSGLCRGATRQEYGGNMTEGHAGAALGGGTPPFPLHLWECSMPRKTLGVATAGSKGAKPPFRQATGRPANGRAGRRSSNCSADPLKLAVSGAFPPGSATRGAVRLGGHDLAAPRKAAPDRPRRALCGRGPGRFRAPRSRPSSPAARFRRVRDRAPLARRRPRAHRACPPWAQCAGSASRGRRRHSARARK